MADRIGRTSRKTALIWKVLYYFDQISADSHSRSILGSEPTTNQVLYCSRYNTAPVNGLVHLSELGSPLRWKGQAGTAAGVQQGAFINMAILALIPIRKFQIYQIPESQIGMISD